MKCIFEISKQLSISQKHFAVEAMLLNENSHNGHFIWVATSKYVAEFSEALFPFCLQANNHVNVCRMAAASTVVRFLRQCGHES